MSNDMKTALQTSITTRTTRNARMSSFSSYPFRTDLRTNQGGMTLIEIMVAIVISLFLLGGLIQIMVGNKQTYRVQDAMARVQENGRFSQYFLTSDIRMAGFMGCSRPSNGLNVTNNISAAGGANGYSSNVDWAYGANSNSGGTDNFTGDGAVQGFSYSGGTIPTELGNLGLVGDDVGGFGSVIANTDVIFIRRAVSCDGANVTGQTTTGGTAQIFIEDNSACQIQQNDIVMVSNCRTADIFGVSNTPTMDPGSTANLAHGANWNDGPLFSNTYGPDSFIYRMRADVYYIGEGSSGQPSLFKRSLRIGQMTSTELVEGIENMSILYGEDTGTLDGVPDIYVDAGSITNIENILSVRITATARTLEDNIATDVTASGDHRIRREFNMTIGIRNRMS